MKIETHQTGNHKIEVIDIIGELSRSGAIGVKEYLCNCIDKGRLYQLINMKQSMSIDGLGIKILEDFINRGMLIRLFHVEPSIQTMLIMAGKNDIIKVYKEYDVKKAITLLEGEISETEKSEPDVKNRMHLRINTSFPAEFKYHPGHNGVISGRTRVINLSESGLMACNISAVHEQNGETVENPELEGQELYGMNFRLNDGDDVIDTKAECVREFRSNERLNAGIRFKDI
ncbi:MAG: hypothetical protein ACUZ8H_11200, partial [Candidatus Anammoxibacter sp.]